MSLLKPPKVSYTPGVPGTSGQPYTRTCPSNYYSQGTGPSPTTSGGTSGCVMETVPVQGPNYTIIGYSYICVPGP